MASFKKLPKDRVQMRIVHHLLPKPLYATFDGEDQARAYATRLIEQGFAMAQNAEPHSSESMLVIASTSGRTECPTGQAGPASCGAR